MSISSDPIFQMLTGFWVSKTLMAAVEVDIFSKVEGRREELHVYRDFKDAGKSRPSEH